jgi:hypothetical protein
MRRSDKVIITCAITGAVHTPSMSPLDIATPADARAMLCTKGKDNVGF